MYFCLFFSSYKKTAVELSAVFKDQIVSPLDQAIYWTEYAIRHKGAPHFRPASKNQNWLQSGLYDIIGVVVFIILAAIICVILAIRVIYKLFFNSKNKKTKTQ